MTTLEVTPYAPVVEPRPSSGLLEGLGLMTLSAFLIPVATLTSPFLGTVLVATLGLAGLAFVLHRKYRGRWQFNAEVALVAGMSIQFLLAPLLNRVISWDFTSEMYYVQSSSDRVAVKDYYAHGMVIVLLFSGVYFVVSALIPLKRASRRAMTGDLPSYFTKRTYFVYALLIGTLWLMRGGLLAIGAFYHSHYVQTRDVDPRYSSWTQFDSGMGPIAAAFVFAAALTRNLNWGVAVAYVSADFVWNFLSGAREKTVTPFIAMVLVYVVYRNRFPWKALLVMLLPGILMMGFMDLYRQTVRRFSDVDRISFTQVTQALLSAKDRSESYGLGTTFVIGLGRISDIEPIAEIYRNVPEVQPYLMGETYERILPSLVPRAWWPDKPVIIFRINEWFFRNEGGTSPVTIMGEGYLNYGWVGVALSAAAIALMLRATDRFMLRLVDNMAMLPVYIGFVALCARLHTNVMAMWISAIIKLGSVAIAVHLLTRWFGERPATSEQRELPATEGWQDVSGNGRGYDTY
jgi:hypothetical protein